MVLLGQMVGNNRSNQIKSVYLSTSTSNKKQHKTTLAKWARQDLK